MSMGRPGGYWFTFAERCWSAGPWGSCRPQESLFGQKSPWTLLQQTAGHFAPVRPDRCGIVGNVRSNFFRYNVILYQPRCGRVTRARFWQAAISSGVEILKHPNVVSSHQLRIGLGPSSTAISLRLPETLLGFAGPIVTEVQPLGAFTVAEAAHQDYGARHPNDACVVRNDAPKLVRLQERYPALYQTRRAP